MLKTKHDIRLKIHLIISVLIVIPVALVYGFFPEILYQDSVSGVRFQHSFKSIMAVYLGFAYLSLMGVFSSKYLKPALLSQVVFMLGLGFGRLISFSIDGLPSLFFTLGTFGELILGFYGLSVLYNEKK